MGRGGRGREEKAVEVFNETIQYYGQLQQDGKIESFAPYFLAPHGGDLGGFVLLHGAREQLDEIVRSEEFERLQARVTMIVDGSGTVQAVHRRGARSRNGSLPGSHEGPRLAAPARVPPQAHICPRRG